MILVPPLSSGTDEAITQDLLREILLQLKFQTIHLQLMTDEEVKEEDTYGGD
jgi:hypothetical protein